jgi:hypothetical protein
MEFMLYKSGKEEHTLSAYGELEIQPILYARSTITRPRIRHRVSIFKSSVGSVCHIMVSSYKHIFTGIENNTSDTSSTTPALWVSPAKSTASATQCSWVYRASLVTTPTSNSSAIPMRTTFSHGAESTELKAYWDSFLTRSHGVCPLCHHPCGLL